MGILRKSALLLVALCHADWGSGMIAMKFALESFTLLQIMTARLQGEALISSSIAA